MDKVVILNPRTLEIECEGVADLFLSRPNGQVLIWPNGGGRPLLYARAYVYLDCLAFRKSLEDMRKFRATYDAVVIT
jgi:hypothetical protein